MSWAHPALLLRRNGRVIILLKRLFFDSLSFFVQLDFESVEVLSEVKSKSDVSGEESQLNVTLPSFKPDEEVVLSKESSTSSSISQEFNRPELLFLSCIIFLIKFDEDLSFPLS